MAVQFKKKAKAKAKAKAKGSAVAPLKTESSKVKKVKGNTVAEVKNKTEAGIGFMEGSLTYFSSDLVDQLQELQEDMYNAKKVLEQYALLENTLHQEFDDTVDSNMGLRVEGAKGFAELTPRGNKSTILVKNDKLITALSQKVFDAVAKVGVGDLKKYLTEEELEGILEVTRTGPRKMTIVAKTF